ncbi:hypothetical protein M758_6G030000 [Ceratodon purpureus]|uniref:Uncharacterized protein n=1 Tax=Ceratodon purpureus TaxID=3225 RepID=A0A8T0HER2_CERPU|nr:hypothetical protein KC19_6G032900 [Ceratodon purpureus]KAG0612466.1 hypothetical protein M758_6G030000 [Ceratodon purpureus]
MSFLLLAVQAVVIPLNDYWFREKENQNSRSTLKVHTHSAHIRIDSVIVQEV